MMTARVHLNKLESRIYLTKRPFYSPHILRPSSPQVDFQNIMRYRTLQGYLICYFSGPIVSFKSVFMCLLAVCFIFCFWLRQLLKVHRRALCCRSQSCRRLTVNLMQLSKGCCFNWALDKCTQLRGMAIVWPSLKQIIAMSSIFPNAQQLIADDQQTMLD